MSLTIYTLKEYNLSNGEDDNRCASRMPVEELDHIKSSLETHGEATQEQYETHEAHHNWLSRAQGLKLVKQRCGECLHHGELLA